MTLIKTRPKIRLILPEWAHPGDRVRAEIILDAKRPVPIDFVRCTLEGWERASWGSGKQSRSYSVRTEALVAEPSGPTDLPEGSTRLKCAFNLQPTAPVSYDGSQVNVEYVIAVHASVPWWPDSRERFVLLVRGKPLRTRGKGRSVHSTRPEGPARDEPHLEFSLNETQLLPGDTVSGELALANVAFNRYRKAQLSLVGSEHVRTEARSYVGTHVAWRYAIEIDVSKAAEGEPIPFAMKLPDNIAPGFEATVGALEWRFEVEVKIAWGKNLTAQVPVAMLPARSTRDKPKARRAVPAVGSPRVAMVWRSVAEAEGLIFDEEARQLHGRIGDVDLRISREHRGGDGVHVSGQLSYPSLHLALDGGVSTGLRRVLKQGIALGHPQWDRRHYVTGREEAQVHAFAAALVPALFDLRLADMDDEKMMVEITDAGTSAAAMRRFVDALRSLASGIRTGRMAIPAPAQMQAAAGSWKALAKALDGPLENARMAVSGRYEGAASHVATEWSVEGAPLHTAIALEVTDPLHEDHLLCWSEERFISGDPAALPGRARAALTPVVAGALSLTVDKARIELWDPAPIVETAHILKRLDQLAALGGALRAHHGPYR